MNKKVLAIVGVAVFGLALFGLTQVSAYRGDYTKVGPNHTPEREAQMQKIMEEKNYEAWKALMTQDGRQPGVVRKIQNQEQFDKFAEAYKLGKEGKRDEATAIRQELGLGNGQGRGGGKGNGTCGMMAQ
jgi:hypothetical protein